MVDVIFMSYFYSIFKFLKISMYCRYLNKNYIIQNLLTSQCPKIKILLYVAIKLKQVEYCRKQKANHSEYIFLIVKGFLNTPVVQNRYKYQEI